MQSYVKRRFGERVHVYESGRVCGRGLQCALVSDFYKENEQNTSKGVVPGTVLFQEAPLYQAPAYQAAFNKTFSEERHGKFLLYEFVDSKDSDDERETVMLPPKGVEELNALRLLELGSTADKQWAQSALTLLSVLRAQLFERHNISATPAVDGTGQQQQQQQQQTKKNKKRPTTKSSKNSKKKKKRSSPSDEGFMDAFDERAILMQNIAFVECIDEDMIDFVLLCLSLSTSKAESLLLARTVQCVVNQQRVKDATLLSSSKSSVAKRKALRAKQSKQHQQVAEIGNGGDQDGECMAPLVCTESNVKPLVLQSGTMGASVFYDRRHRRRSRLLYEALPARAKRSFEWLEFHQVACCVRTQLCFLNELAHGDRTWSLYPLCSLLEHSCRPNAVLIHQSDGSMQCRAIDFIGRGEPLHIHYLSAHRHAATHLRQNALFMHFLFRCHCIDCFSPSGDKDRGDRWRSFWCQLCNKGCVRPVYLYEPVNELAMGDPMQEFYDFPKIPWNMRVYDRNVHSGYSVVSDHPQTVRWQCDRCTMVCERDEVELLMAEEHYISTLLLQSTRVHGSGSGNCNDDDDDNNNGPLSAEEVRTRFREVYKKNGSDVCRVYEQEWQSRREKSTLWPSSFGSLSFEQAMYAHQRRLMHPSHHLLAHTIAEVFSQRLHTVTSIGSDQRWVAAWDEMLLECHDQHYSRFDPCRIAELESVGMAQFMSDQRIEAYDTFTFAYLIARHALGNAYPKTIELYQYVAKLAEMVQPGQNNGDTQRHVFMNAALGNNGHTKAPCSGVHNKTLRFINDLRQLEPGFPNAPNLFEVNA